MALLTLTFPPGTCATISKSGSTWIVTSVNATNVTISVDDIDDNGTISGSEWDSAIGGGGNDTGNVGYLFEGSGSSGQLYSTDGTTTFVVGQDVTTIKNGMSNTFEANVSGVICLGEGTKILAENGPVPIEALSIGDKVVVNGDRLEVLRWIGRCSLDQKSLEDNYQFRPVCISAGALGAGLPKKDLIVSRHHRMLMRSKIAARMFGSPEVLVPAIKLTALPGIYVDEKIQSIVYFHILFDNHEIIYAEGAPTESLFTGPEVLKAVSPKAQNEILNLFPKLAELTYTPKPTRYIPTGYLQKKLIARHVKNNKPLFQV